MHDVPYATNVTMIQNTPFFTCADITRNSAPVLHMMQLHRLIACVATLFAHSYEIKSAESRQIRGPLPQLPMQIRLLHWLRRSHCC